MSGRPTIYEVAHRCGVSTATVSRVMSGGQGFSELTRKRVLAAAEEIGWSPNTSARGLAARRTGIVGLLFPDLGKAANVESESALFVDQVIRGAEHAATSAGSAVLLAGTRGRGGQDLLRSISGRVDGVVVVARAVPTRRLDELRKRMPVVVLSPLESRHPLDFVTADNRVGMCELVSHLLVHHGYRDIAFVAGPKGSPDSQERFAGYREAFTAAGLHPPAQPDEHGDFTERGGELAIQRLLDGRGSVPQAIVAGNDEMALGALAVLHHRRIRVPAEVAVTGFDDITATRHVRPALTTVRQPMREIGEQAVRVLLARIEQPEHPRRTVVLPTEVVVRRSCGCRSRLRTPESTPGRTAP